MNGNVLHNRNEIFITTILDVCLHKIISSKNERRQSHIKESKPMKSK